MLSKWLKYFSIQRAFTPIRSGFTLIELLIVISVLGVLSVGVVTALNVTTTIDKAKIAKAKTFAASVENSLSISQVGKWNFNDSSLPGKDISGYGNNGTLNGNTAWTAAAACGLELEGCLSFDNFGDYVQVPANASVYNFQQAMTISFWVKLNAIPTINVGVGQAGFSKWIYINTLGRPCFNIQNDNANYPATANLDFCDTKSLDTGKWYHLAATYILTSSSPSSCILDASPFIACTVTGKLYVNGALAANPAPNTNYSQRNTAGNYIRMGTRIHALNPSSEPSLNGHLDDVQLYNQSLSLSQIQKLYAQGLIKHLLAFR